MQGGEDGAEASMVGWAGEEKAAIDARNAKEAAEGTNREERCAVAYVVTARQAIEFMEAFDGPTRPPKRQRQCQNTRI